MEKSWAYIKMLWNNKKQEIPKKITMDSTEKTIEAESISPFFFKESQKILRETDSQEWRPNIEGFLPKQLSWNLWLSLPTKLAVFNQLVYIKWHSNNWKD